MRTTISHWSDGISPTTHNAIHLSVDVDLPDLAGPAEQVAEAAAVRVPRIRSFLRSIGHSSASIAQWEALGEAGRAAVLADLAQRAAQHSDAAFWLSGEAL